MTRRRNLYVLHKMAESYSTTPAALLGLVDPYSSWCVNEVAYLWGMSVDMACNNARQAQEDVQLGSQAATATLNQLLRDDASQEEEDVQTAPKGRFRDPAADFAAASRAPGRPQ